MTDWKASALSGAIEGLAGMATEIVVRKTVTHVKRLFGNGLPIAEGQASENIDLFGQSLLDRIENGNDDAVGRALQDPDTIPTVIDAFAAAARTSDAGAHDLLGRLVEERLRSASRSTRAVTSAEAIALVPRLAPEHLELLGFLAFVEFGALPDGLSVDEYAAKLSAVPQPPGRSTLFESIQYLGSVGALTFLGVVRTEAGRVLVDAHDGVLEAIADKLPNAADRARLVEAGQRVWPHEPSPRGEPAPLGYLTSVWSNTGLRIAPVGALIGARIYDMHAQTDIATRLEWGPPGP